MRVGLGHRFAAAWLRVRAAFGDGVENSQPISLFALLSKRPHLTTSLVFKTPPLYVHALIFCFLLLHMCGEKN